MRRFAALYSELDASSGTTARVDALARYFTAVEPGEAIWALQVLLGRQRRRLITGRRLRQICQEGLDLPEWLFDDCHAQVGDSAETIALLWPTRPAAAVFTPIDSTGRAPASASPHASGSLQEWMEALLPRVAALRDREQVEAVWQLWQDLEPLELLVVCKLLSGGLRVGVAGGLVVRALARCSGLEQSLLQHRLMGEWIPTAAAWQELLAPAQADQAVPSRPYPFFLASPLQQAPPPTGDGDQPLPGPAHTWLAEWKWDGIRGQLIRRAGQTFLWSRGEELIHLTFPELITAAAALPEGTVLDGEVIVWEPGATRPQPFASLQRRLGRQRPDRRIIATCPVVFLAYDLLERHGVDLRDQPLSQRRLALEALLQADPAAAATPGAEVLRLSPALPLADWRELEPLRQRAESAGAEGLMLKALASPYLSGRRRGFWWKHKRDPYRLDAVLLYAQAGSGRRANLFTDYTFALWDRPALEAERPCQATAAATPAAPAPAAATAAPSETAPPSAAASPSAAAHASVTTGEEATAEQPMAEQETAEQQVAAPRRLVSFAKAYSGLDDSEIQQLDRWIRSHTLERYGPVRAVQPLQVFELAFEGLQRSGRHKSGIAVRFPRISRWRHDKPAAEADSLQEALALLEAAEDHPPSSG
ncbi:MAG: ATP-dependent DNA ligase [Cyanobium sp.]